MIPRYHTAVLQAILIAGDTKYLFRYMQTEVAVCILHKNLQAAYPRGLKIMFLFWYKCFTYRILFDCFTKLMSRDIELFPFLL